MIHHVKQSEVVAYSSFEMFELVADVDHYKDFLPWCSGSEVLERQNGEVLAEIRLSYGPVKAAFTTRNENHPNEFIKMRLVRGSLKHFEGSWHFEKLPQGGTRVSLDLRYEFSHTIMGVFLGSILHKISKAVLLAFKQRAGILYGRRIGSSVKSPSPKEATA
jgi:coenzyme Q-binding protein COQ10